MKLTSEHPFWAQKNGLLSDFPAMENDVTCKVAILGGGITGSLAAEELSRRGHSVCLIDKRDIGWGSTSASTALLQYEIDTHLVALTEKYGWESARAAYRACYESIDRIEQLTERLGAGNCAFRRRPSVYLASTEKDVNDLLEEAGARKRAGIPLTVWNPAEVREHFPFEAPLALVSKQGAEVDPYQLTHALLDAARANGAAIYDRTALRSIECSEREVRILTERETQIVADWVVIATGYEAGEKFDTGSLVNLNSSFAVASAPVAEELAWWERCLLWESARPYFYLRSDDNGRIIMGGEDEPFKSPAIRDKMIAKKAERLESRFADMFPDIPMEVEYAWAGTFGETADGLPYLGERKEYPRCLFALGYGGNGITFSEIAARMHAETIEGRRHSLDPVFKFER